MSRVCLIFTFLLAFISSAWSKAILDKDVQTAFDNPGFKTKAATTLLVFFKQEEAQSQFEAFVQQFPEIKVKSMQSLPALALTMPLDKKILEAISNHPATAQISSFHPGVEELENSEQAILLKPSEFYPMVNNWWNMGYTGQHGVVGLLDSGVDLYHPSLQGKTIYVRQDKDSGFSNYKNGVRSAHGTGVACIYGGQGSEVFPSDQGIAFGVPTFLVALAGEGDGKVEDIAQTLSSLDWMLNHKDKPTVINYSFGNGPVACESCTDWSGLARIVDHVVNRYKILWVKSAGNLGFVERSDHPPFYSSLSSPADNFNGLTVANMNPSSFEQGRFVLSPDRSQHFIRYTSSRGPTKDGRKKPDLTAPGNNTRTCAPDPALYAFKYSKEMDYHDGYRLMGGTSSAAPHVGAALLLLQEAGIHDPMAQKALLINSADAWTDHGKAGMDDPKSMNKGEHGQVQGSEWNRTYGWGYLNMQTAFEQRFNLALGTLTLDEPIQTFMVDLPVGGKVTLVHERRVGYHDNFNPWLLSHLSLELIDADTHEVLDADESPIDTVHQVSNCKKTKGAKTCSNRLAIHAMVVVKLVSNHIDGSFDEPFAIAMSVSFK